MKKSVIFLLLIINCIGGMAQQPGDSLALLYRRVYVYRNPDELATRLTATPYSYYNSHRFKYISTDKKYPSYFKILTPEGDTAYVKSKMVSADQSLTHEQIREEISKGLRSKDPGKKVRGQGPDLPRWASWAIILGVIGLLILFWVKFKVFDSWFCRMNSSNTKKLRKPWFIKFSVIPGVVIGGIELFSPKESNWFKQEGFQIWGSYPSNWDWIMWGAVVSVIFVALGAVIQAFIRFRPKIAVFYALFSLVVITIYFSVGIYIGALVVVIMFLGGGGGSSSSSSSSGSTSPSEPEGSIKVVNGRRMIKTNRGTWDYF